MFLRQLSFTLSVFSHISFSSFLNPCSVNLIVGVFLWMSEQSEDLQINTTSNIALFHSLCPVYGHPTFLLVSRMELPVHPPLPRPRSSPFNAFYFPLSHLLSPLPLPSLLITSSYWSLLPQLSLLAFPFIFCYKIWKIG